MLFGNSYKRWQEQYREYVSLMTNKFGPVSPLRAWKSRAEWKGWGGLKWCSDSSFQEELNREGCQSGEPDNKNPRKYADMVFEEFTVDQFANLL